MTQLPNVHSKHTRHILNRSPKGHAVFIILQHFFVFTGDASIRKCRKTSSVGTNKDNAIRRCTQYFTSIFGGSNNKKKEKRWKINNKNERNIEERKREKKNELTYLLLRSIYLLSAY